MYSIVHNSKMSFINGYSSLDSQVEEEADVVHVDRALDWVGVEARRVLADLDVRVLARERC